MQPDELQLVSSTQIEGFLSPERSAKELNSQIQWVFTHRKKEYLDDLLSLWNYKSVSVRRAIAKQLDTLQPHEKLDAIIHWQENESDRATVILLQTVIDKIQRGIQVETNARVYSVAEVLEYARRMLTSQVLEVEGEIGADIKLYGENRYYFSLKGSDETALTCMAMSFVIAHMNAPMNPGLKVRVTGQLKVNKQGKIQCEVKHIQLTGEGELIRALAELQAKLTKEGLFDTSRKRSLPIYPKTILLIASKASAALTDYQKILKERRGGATIYHIPTKTQGVGAEAEILKALDAANTLCASENIDLIVLTRGGGSQEDLHVFNSEKIVRAIHGLIRPCIVAIGHEKDITLSELVADKRCSTPSQAAEFSSISRAEARASMMNSLQLITSHILKDIKEIDSESQRIIYRIPEIVRKVSSEYLKKAGEFVVSITSFPRRIREQIHETYRSVLDFTNHALKVIQKSLPDLTPLTDTTLQRLASVRNQTESLWKSIHSLSYESTLSRGFAIVKKKDKIIESYYQVAKDEVVTILFRDGKKRSIITD